eukprot:scaffold2958_cov162-Skeletonema_dohrnii-CCMP3373.AAC.1
MSSIGRDAEESDLLCCVSCGIAEAEVDDIKLTECPNCKLVRYCSVRCQRKHRPRHKQACKKRAAELRDELLFRQPESSHLGDCPLAGGLSDKELDQNTMKRVEANDIVAMSEMAKVRSNEGDFSTAYEYWKKAAEMGDADSHYQLSALYNKDDGFERDEKKQLYHMEEAAIGGHPIARYNLGCVEGNKGRNERAMKHFIIAANLGFDSAIEMLKGEYASGNISKEDFATALRAHHAAVNATTSPQREAAAAKSVTK